MKNCLLLIGALLAFTATSYAQQLIEENVFGQYILNPVLVNPGATGFQEAHIAQMNIKSAWAGFNGAPKTYALNYNGAFGNVLGLGASVRSENAASLTSLHIGLNYAFRFQPTKDFKLAVGLSTEFTTRRLSDAILGDKLIEGGDEILQGNIVGFRTFDVSAGVYGSLKEKTFFGVSLPNAVQNRLNTIVSPTIDSTSRNFKSFTFLIGHRIDIKNQDFSLEPSILVKKLHDVNDSPIQVDINLLTRFLEDRLAAGLSYRYGLTEGGTVAVLLGTKVTAFKVYYAYDISFGQFQSYSGGGHEITLAFDLQGENNRSRRNRQNKRKKR